jgi:phage tail-like protein
MRGLIEGLATPHHLAVALPAVFHEDPFAMRLVAALDEVLAPEMLVLDNFDAYLDPHTAPPDFLEWLSGWVGIVLDETWTLEQQRDMVARATQLYSQRGTREGLAGTVALYAGSEPEIEDSGGTAVNFFADGPLPGSDTPMLTVRVRVGPGRSVDHRRLDALVQAAKPANLPHTIEIVSS